MSIPISEIFGPTIQGEGQLIGIPTIFVRVGGCDYRCSWCDSYYAVDPEYRSSWKMMNTIDIFGEIQKSSRYQPILVTLSGGNPAIYDFANLIQMGQSAGYRFAMETQGSITRAYFNNLDYLTVSPKPPSSQITLNQEKLSQVLKSNINSNLKIVVADENDYLFAKQIHHQYPHIPMVLQPCNLTASVGETANLQTLKERLEWLIGRTHQDAWYNVTLLPQLHVMLWNNERGV